MTTAELRDKIDQAKKYPGTEQIKADSVINAGYPSCFTLSFGEPPMLERFGQYLDYDSNFIFTKIQPCIRHQDWPSITEKPEDERHLAVFDMAGIGGMIILLDHTKQEKITKFSIDTTMELLMSLGLDKDKLRIAYFESTPIVEATKGKYAIDKVFPTDPYASYWKDQHGLRQDQLIPNHDRDTMLALNVFGLPTPWGYRYEILYDYKGELLDIATVEYLNYRPLFDESGKINDVVPFDHAFAASVVGLERLAMVVNNLNHIWEIDTIKLMVDSLFEASTTKDNAQVVIAVQALRALHRIIADSGLYTTLNKRRKEYARNFYRPYFLALEQLGIADTTAITQTLLELNASLNPWYPELQTALETAATEFLARKEAFDNDQSLKAE